MGLGPQLVSASPALLHSMLPADAGTDLTLICNASSRNRHSFSLKTIHGQKRNAQRATEPFSSLEHSALLLHEM